MTRGSGWSGTCRVAEVVHDLKLTFGATENRARLRFGLFDY